MHPTPTSLSTPAKPLMIISGGNGASGSQIVRTLLAQFPALTVPVRVETNVAEPAHLAALVEEAVVTHALVVHTLVDASLRQQLISLAQAKGVIAVDLFGPLLAELQRWLHHQPLGKPGLYHQLNAAYFQRIDAIEYAVAHDDGKRVEELPLADIVLLGVSRVGKTPLSMYLSVLGWKVANLPVVPTIEPPPVLFTLEPRRVVGLTITPQQLLAHRRWRIERLGLRNGSYVERLAIQEELTAAHHFFAAHGFAVVDTTNKPIETCGEEVVAAITQGLAGLEFPAYPAT